MFAQKAMITMPSIKKTQHKTVLVIDSYDRISRLMEQALRSVFDNVLVAEDPHEAIRFLEMQDITHLLCDFNLGLSEDADSTNGYAFVEFCRREFHDIERAVILSNLQIDQLSKPDGIDAIVSKTKGIKDVIDVLLDNGK